MRWSRIQLIFRRELRDQLRDRRTVFMVFGLPIVLYPVIGMTVGLILSNLGREPRTVVVIGAEHLPEEPPLLVPGESGGLRIHPELSPEAAEQFLIRRPERGDRWGDDPARLLDEPAEALEALRADAVDAFVLIPPETRDRIEQLGERPTIRIAFDPADEQSLEAYRALDAIIARWQQAIVGRRLAEDEKPEQYVNPVAVEAVDVPLEAEGSSAVGTNVWARFFPFLLVMMALTGAFYPAVDLCAGEKERGTMETLLISPAYRSEIVVGKFLTVVTASAGTALLNLASMGLTATLLMPYLGDASVGEAAKTEAELSLPSASAMVWIGVLVVPLAAFFGAVCLALAVLARSMKEGQYYMTPLYLVAMPLTFLTLLPGVELNPFYSLVPISGVSLLLKELMLEQYTEARRYFLPVLFSTIVYGAVALRWAVGQFRTEQVLFREAERFDLRSWLRHLVRDRGPAPSGGEAIACFAAILVLSWYAALAPTGIGPLISMALCQISCVLGLSVAMAMALTSRPLQTLRLRWPGLGPIVLGVALAAAYNPLAAELRPIVERLFPVPRAAEQFLGEFFGAIPNLPVALLLLAVVPAICEEIAFRGFILSGLESAHRRWAAIVLSAFLFGFMHVLLSSTQQFINATLLGLVLGLMAVKTRSLWPGVAFHMTNNGLVVASALLIAGGRVGAPGWLYREPEQLLYHWPWVALGAIVSAALLAALALGNREATADAEGPVAEVR